MVLQATILAIRSCLPEGRLTNQELSKRFPDWTAEKIQEKTGISERAIAAPEECASDLAVAAATRLFRDTSCPPNTVDLLVFCTQSPDYLLPTTACMIQDRLALPSNCMAFDVNLGCSNFIYALAVVKALLESGIRRKALLLTGDTYSKYINPVDRNLVTLFGDAATATLMEGQEVKRAAESIGPFVFGTDGSGYANLILPGSGCRKSEASSSHAGRDRSLYMDGPKVFEFTLKRVPETVEALLAKAACNLQDIDLFVFHQANKFMLDTLRKKLNIPEDKFAVNIRSVGNTVSCTIPLLLEELSSSGRLVKGMRVALVGFGVGYSWGSCLIRWS